MEIAAATALIIAIIAVCTAVFILRRVKRQIAEMANILEEVKNGNGGRRILAETHDITASLAYEMNDIIVSYESRLSAFRQTEETNKQLMTSLSHDVRTPLTTLIGYLDAAHKGVVSGKERDDYIETARHKAYDLKEYIDVLFDWFKLGSNEFSMNIKTVDLTELTRNILADWIPVFEDAKIDFAATIPEYPFWVKVDEDGYLRIINNLVQNAVSHSHADKIEITLLEQDGSIRILLSDNGVGMDKEDLKHIFERLYKCDKGRSQKGSGLGLSIVSQLVEKMSGSIYVESIPGSGTIFTLCFPLERLEIQ
ncbi:MAG: HAMP domain-containing histidine kinase [Clostridium sp.]|nr:HAMP domain-containing histidine kinase [Clostridium sp.]